MADAIAAAFRFSAGRRREALDQDEMLLFALVRAVEIVGEAAANVSESTRAEVGIHGLPWSGCGTG